MTTTRDLSDPQERLRRIDANLAEGYFLVEQGEHPTTIHATYVAMYKDIEWLATIAEAARGWSEPTILAHRPDGDYRMCQECQAMVPWAEWESLVHAPDCRWLVLQCALAGE